jgi:ABC-type microcin C transport system duplicated ATPase subunit YejF
MIRFEQQDLLQASDEELRRIRGNEIAMIFQDPLSSLHPFYKVATQLVEAVRTHRNVSNGWAAIAPSSCWSWSGSQTRAGASTSTPTSPQAACASGR